MNHELIRIKSQSFAYYISSGFKNLNYFTSFQRTVTFIDTRMRVESKFTINCMSEANNETLPANLSEDEVTNIKNI